MLIFCGSLSMPKPPPIYNSQQHTEAVYSPHMTARVHKSSMERTAEQWKGSLRESSWQSSFQMCVITNGI